jgi:CheY-like chemotaxis protein
MIKFKSILLIDDDEDCRFLTKNSLEKLQIAEAVSVFPNGKEAIDFIINNHIKPKALDYSTIIFIDYHMPGMN